MALVVDDGEGPGVGRIEQVHDVGHIHLGGDFAFRADHDVLDRHAFVETGLEHDVAQVVERDDAHEGAIGIAHGIVVVGLGGDDLDQFAQLHFGTDHGIVLHDEVLQIEQGEHGFVLVVSDELALLCQTAGVDGVGLEDADGAVAEAGGDHEGKEEVEATRELGREEHAHQGRMHHAAHHGCHAHHGEVLLGQEGEEARLVEHIGKEEACEVAEEERGGERTTTTSTAIGSCRGEALGEHHHDDEEAEDPETAVGDDLAEAAEGGVVEDGASQDIVVLAVVDVLDGFVTFTIERGQQEDGYAQEGASQHPFDPGAVDALELIFGPEGGAGEVERGKTAEDAKQDDVGNALDGEVHGLGEVEERGGAFDGVCHGGGSHGRDQERHDAEGGEIEHKHLDGEQQSGDRSLEDAGYTGGGSAAQQDHEGMLVHTEQSAQVGADGRAGEYDRGLGTYRSAKADGDARGQHGGVHIVHLDDGLALRDGVEDLGDTVADVIAHNVSHIATCDEDAQHWIEQVEVVGTVDIEVEGQQMLEMMDQPLQDEGGCGSGQSGEEGEDEHELLAGEMLLSPADYRFYCAIQCCVGLA